MNHFMKKKSTGLCHRSAVLVVTLSVIVISVIIFNVGITQSVQARCYEYYLPKPGETIDKARVVEQDGIVYHIPPKTSTSREAAVEFFPDSAVISPYIYYEGEKYTVTWIYRTAPDTEISDTNTCVTLPATIKQSVIEFTCEKGLRHVIFNFHGVRNIHVENLDSFLKNCSFAQIRRVPPIRTIPTYTYEIKPHAATWNLYVNGNQVTDIEYPEGSKLGVNITHLAGINTVTIPASDTARKEPLNWYKYGLREISDWPHLIKFKADSGYDLRYYAINADFIELPRKMEVLNGLGTIPGDIDPYYELDETRKFRPDERYCIWKKKPKVYRWPDNLHTILSLDGLNVRFDELPASVTKYGDLVITNLKNVYIPSHVCHIDSICYDVFNSLGLSIRGDTPLKLGRVKSKVYYESSYLGNQYTRMMHSLKLDRPIEDLTPDAPYKMFDAAIDSLYFMPGFTNKITERMFRPSVNDAPRYIICNAPAPDFETSSPGIYNWHTKTKLIILQKYYESYATHPIWCWFTKESASEDQRINDADIVSEQWHTIDGKIVKTPESGNLYIHTITYSDGSTSRQKVMMPR